MPWRHKQDEMILEQTCSCLFSWFKIGDASTYVWLGYKQQVEYAENDIITRKINKYRQQKRCYSEHHQQRSVTL